jgi:hypothetical protein
MKLRDTKSCIDLRTRGKRVIVFDLDHTLIHGSKKPLKTSPIIREIYLKSIDVYVYTRPHAIATLYCCIKDSRNIVVIWSAGCRNYVDNVVDDVLLPRVRSLIPGFNFPRIYYKDNLDDNGIKRVDKLVRKLGVGSAILIDDSQSQCLGCGSEYCKVSPFLANSASAENDEELLLLLRNPLFITES